MPNRTKTIQLIILMMLIGSVLISGCGFFTEEEPTPTMQPPVTVVVTQVITQIIPETATPMPTMPPTQTPEPTATVLEVGGLNDYDPYSVPLWYPFDDCPASRLHVGDRAFVTIGGGPNAVRFGADVHYDNVIGYAEEGEGVLIADGPYCFSGWIVWEVDTDGGLHGYTPEGDGNEYWLLPDQK